MLTRARHSWVLLFSHSRQSNSLYRAISLISSNTFVPFAAGLPSTAKLVTHLCKFTAAAELASAGCVGPV